MCSDRSRPMSSEQHHQGRFTLIQATVSGGTSDRLESHSLSILGCLPKEVLRTAWLAAEECRFSLWAYTKVG